MPSDHCTSSRNSATFGWSSGASSGSGKPAGLKILASAPIAVSNRAASSTSNRLNERVRNDP